MADAGLVTPGVRIVVDEVTAVDTGAKVAMLKAGVPIGYDKLILGTGSLPTVPR